ncbi:MAG: hypothetical protein JW742_03365 [Candidatus Aminicenantes bacterium]|nr:hypothetical protein [Candidatus Aminicenantes bacterium]
MYRIKKTVLFTIVLGVLAAPALAGVVKKSRTQVAFKGFGVLTMEQGERIASDRKASETKTEFKGKGIMGKTLGSALLRSGSFGEIIDLPAMTVTSLDNKKKEYQTRPIEKIAMGEATGGSEPEPDAEARPSESDIKIIRSEFKVEATGETETLNGFPSEKYAVLWQAEWENVKTGARGTEKMTTLVWTTPMSDDLQAEEMTFSRAYLKAVGLDQDVMERSVLGGQWIQALASMNPANPAPSPQGRQVAKELAKIKGYPVLIDGKYFSIRPEGEAQVEEKKGGGMPSLGKLAMGALKKKPKPGEENEPTVSYVIETLELAAAAVDETAFLVPAGYKQK